MQSLYEIGIRESELKGSERELPFAICFNKIAVHICFVLCKNQTLSEILGTFENFAMLCFQNKAT